MNRQRGVPYSCIVVAAQSCDSRRLHGPKLLSHIRVFLLRVRLELGRLSLLSHFRAELLKAHFLKLGIANAPHRYM